MFVLLSSSTATDLSNGTRGRRNHCAYLLAINVGSFIVTLGQTTYLERHGKRNEGDGIHQERNGEDGHGQKTVAFLGRWPMLPASKQA